MKKLTSALRVITILLLLSTLAFPCTTAIVSGKYTKDGRPLMFKHRDSGFFQNKMMYFDDGKFNYIGLINSEDKSGDEVWAGSNSAGFSIMNSASYNLNMNDGVKLKDREGVVMKKALQECATLADFEKLLDNWEKPMGVEANFGVIDAFGGAAYYETSNYSWKKFDATDDNTAPHGYLIRTNYSVSGSEGDGYGYIRYKTADELFTMADNGAALTSEFIIQSVSRCLKHSLTGIDLAKSSSEFVHFEDFIPRYSSVSTMVVEGLKEGEPVELTTIWSVLGFQLTSVAIPMWVAAGPNLPEILVANKSGVAPLCDMSLKVKESCFPINRGSGKRYINAKSLVNEENTGIIQKLAPVEKEIVSKGRGLITSWRNGKFVKTDAENYYKFVSDYVRENYKKLFSVN